MAKTMEGNGDAKAGRTGVNQDVEEWGRAGVQKKRELRGVYLCSCKMQVPSEQIPEIETKIGYLISHISQFGTIFLCIVNKLS